MSDELRCYASPLQAKEHCRVMAVHQLLNEQVYDTLAKTPFQG